MSLTPTEYSSLQKAKALIKAATVPDRRDLTRGANQALDARLSARIPDTVTDPLERAERLAQLRTAHFLMLSVKAQAARRKATDLCRQAREAEAELEDIGGAA